MVNERKLPPLPPETLAQCVGRKAKIVASDPTLSPELKAALDNVAIHAGGALPQQNPIALSRQFYKAELINPGVDSKVKESMLPVAVALNDRLMTGIEAECALPPKPTAPKQR